MKVYNKEKTIALENYDIEKGYLKEDVIMIHYPEVAQVKEQGHYKTIVEYPNGGKEVEWVVDVKGVEYQPAKDKEENIQIYIPYSEEELKERRLESLRLKRETECFSIINRGKLWYSKLDNDQILELNNWYQRWLDVTITLIEPNKPEWLK